MSIVIDETFDEFMRGICDATGMSRIVADAQWAGHSRQKSDSARAAVERGGPSALSHATSGQYKSSESRCSHPVSNHGVRIETGREWLLLWLNV